MKTLEEIKHGTVSSFAKPKLRSALPILEEKRRAIFI
jgi:hypothetical protein